MPGKVICQGVGGKDGTSSEDFWETVLSQLVSGKKVKTGTMAFGIQKPNGLDLMEEADRSLESLK